MTAGKDDDGRRLDRLLRKSLPELPLSAIHRLLRKGRVLVDGAAAQGADRVRAGSVIQIAGMDDTPSETVRTAPWVDAREPSAAHDKRAPLPPLAVLHEGAGLLILNKPGGIAVHGSDRRSAGSLEAQVRDYLAGRRSPSLSFRPGPLHRLDKPTSGVIVFSTSLEGAQRFSTLIRERRLTKRYLALVDGVIDDNHVWEDALVRDHSEQKTFIGEGEPDAQFARSRVFSLAVTEKAPFYSLIMVAIDTGRTHQIRSQAAHHGHPLAGDRKYGGGFQEGGLLLHAWTLEFPAAAGCSLPPMVTAPLPERFRRRLASLFGKKFAQTLDDPSQGFHFL